MSVLARMQRGLRGAVVALAAAGMAGTAALATTGQARSEARGPSLQPLPPPAPVNAALAELGRHLYFEPRLSGDGSRSCASCHEPARGWSDGLPLARGYNGTEYFRNAPGLLSVRLKPRLAWDGRLDGGDLPTAVRDMLTEAHFMNADARLVQERVRQIPTLMALWRATFGPAAEPYGPQIFTAIAEHLKTLDAPATAVDAHLRGESDPLAAPVRVGLALFHGKAGCVRCHNGPLGSDGRAHRLGVPDAAALVQQPLRTITLLRHHATLGVPGAMDERGDVGLYAITKQPADRGRFMTPSLRALAHTGPYMHNGAFATLEQVVDFHAGGGGPGSELAPVALDARERAALVALLRALSGALAPVAEPVPGDYAPVPRALP